jgi:hypothetical protein
MIYKKIGKHRRRCPVCGKLIKDGDDVVARKLVMERYYPLKGIMKFSKWQFYHSLHSEPGVCIK